ncbi:MATE family efflux transporter [Treponema sp.]|uniref:MATE family efflux transporter n=1 Tax=Treponema sp. TaxID=166 RepID=UPI003EFFDC3B
MQENSLEKYNSMSVPRAVMCNIVPAMLAMLMTLIYNLADTFFIAQTHDALQVAAVSIATPVFLIFMSVGNVFGIGGTSVISRALGAGKKDFARKTCSFCMWTSVACGVLLSVAFILFMNPILRMIGASEETLAFTRSYLTIVALGGTFSLVASAYSNILRAEGKAAKAMTGQILGNLLNIVLDPIMILLFGWNIAGAAIATVIGNVAAAMFYIIHYVSGKSSLSISPRDFSGSDGICTGVLAIGIPASLASVLMSVSQIVMNSLMSGYGDMALAGIGVAMKVTMITGMIALGVGQGVQPLLGFCIGNGNKKRFGSIMKFSLAVATFISTLMTVVCYVFVNQIAGAFLQRGEAFDFSVRFVKILLSTSCLFGGFYVLVNSLQAMGAAKESLVINMSRQGLIYIPSLFILNGLLGVTGLVWAQPVADVLSTVIAVVLYKRFR